MTTNPTPDDVSEWKRLKKFARDVILALAELDSPYGLQLKAHLEDEFGYADDDDEEVYQRRLYGTLNDLREKGLVKVEPVDGRTKSYSLTARGRTLLEARTERQVEATDFDEPAVRSDGGDD